jgi:hypothetical protein
MAGVTAVPIIAALSIRIERGIHKLLDLVPHRTSFVTDPVTMEWLAAPVPSLAIVCFMIMLVMRGVLLQQCRRIAFEGEGAQPILTAAFVLRAVASVGLFGLSCVFAAGVPIAMLTLEAIMEMPFIDRREVWLLSVLASFVVFTLQATILCSRPRRAHLRERWQWHWLAILLTGLSWALIAQAMLLISIAAVQVSLVFAASVAMLVLLVMPFGFAIAFLACTRDRPSDGLNADLHGPA